MSASTQPTRRFLYSFENGGELTAYLDHRGKNGGPAGSDCPRFLVLEPNMSAEDAREALREIKAGAGLKRTPVVVLMPLLAEEEILRSQRVEANPHPMKPATFEGLVEKIKQLQTAWLNLVQTS